MPYLIPGFEPAYAGGHLSRQLFPSGQAGPKATVNLGSRCKGVGSKRRANLEHRRDLFMY